ncbi:hypothetical protein QQF64_035598 [Cirrhinus molitorella]|uniref:Secreted protein n=1 Tax=Cirrhinus molitorella TaxID=172907 RepID=A0ABR3NG94_9TELE
MFRLTVLCAADWITPAFRASLLAEFGRARRRGTGAAARAALDTHTLTALVTFFSAHPLECFSSTIPSKNLSSQTTSAPERQAPGRERRGCWSCCCSEFLTNASLSHINRPALYK